MTMSKRDGDGPCPRVGCDLEVLDPARPEAIQREGQGRPGCGHDPVRLGQARKLLQETEWSVAEIALRSGYENASAMARAFRAEFGVSPSALRAGRYQEEGQA